MAVRQNRRSLILSWAVAGLSGIVVALVLIIVMVPVARQYDGSWETRQTYAKGIPYFAHALSIPAGAVILFNWSESGVEESVSVSILDSLGRGIAQMGVSGNGTLLQGASAFTVMVTAPEASPGNLTVDVSWIYVGSAPLI